MDRLPWLVCYSSDKVGHPNYDGAMQGCIGRYVTTLKLDPNVTVHSLRGQFWPHIRIWDRGFSLAREFPRNSSDRPASFAGSRVACTPGARSW